MYNAARTEYPLAIVQQSNELKADLQDDLNPTVSTNLNETMSFPAKTVPHGS